MELVHWGHTGKFAGMSRVNLDPDQSFVGTYGAFVIAIVTGDVGPPDRAWFNARVRDSNIAL